MKNTANHLLGPYLLSPTMAILSLFLISVPITYMSVVANNAWQYLYISMRAVRILLVFAIGYLFRKRYYSIISNNEFSRKKIMLFLVILIFISLLLHISGMSEKLYFSISSSLRIFWVESKFNILKAVLWEQFFCGDFYYSILLCSFTLFSRLRKRDYKIV